MGRQLRTGTLENMQTAKHEISLRIRAVWFDLRCSPPQQRDFVENIRLIAKILTDAWLCKMVWGCAIRTCPKGLFASRRSIFRYSIFIMFNITKARLYNFDPLKPHFYILKLGFTGVYRSSNEYPQSMFWAEIWKISDFFIWKFSDIGGEIFYIIE